MFSDWILYINVSFFRPISEGDVVREQARRGIIQGEPSSSRKTYYDYFPWNRVLSYAVQSVGFSVNTDPPLYNRRKFCSELNAH